MCFLIRGLSHTWGPTSSGSVWFWWVIHYYFLSRRKILWDHRRQLLTRLGDDFRLLYLINTCILRFGCPNSGKPGFPLSETHPSPTTEKHMAQPLGCHFIFPLPAQAALLPVEHANYCLFWHFFWNELFKKVRYTGSSTYSFLNLELSTLCLFLSPWIMSVP